MTAISSIGARCSMASEKRSTLSRAPLFSREFTKIRHRSHANAWRILGIGSDPVERGGARLTAHEPDEQLFERLRPAGAGAQLRDWSLRNEPAARDDADVRRQALDDLQDVRRQEDRAAAADEREQEV